MTDHEVSSSAFINGVKPSVRTGIAFAAGTGCVSLDKTADGDDPRGEENDKKYKNCNNK